MGETAMVASSARHVELTAVYRKIPEGHIGFIEGFPGVNTQVRTLGEARANLREAVELVLEADRDLARHGPDEVGVIREPLRIRAA